MSAHTNYYHGCKVEGDIAQPGAKGYGWTYRVYAPDGTDLGPCDTLAEAVAIAKTQAAVLNESPAVAEAATDAEETNDE